MDEMSDVTFTEWFNVKIIVPFHKGVYEMKETQFKGKSYSYWDGEKFCWIGDSIMEAMRGRKMGTSHTYTIWRGLANEPK